MTTKLGLRIDVDTLRGTKKGVPNLLNILSKHSCFASFFFSVGPDNMGRMLWRLLRPAYFIKMMRTKASKLYGWNILLMGTLWPGPKILKRCKDIVLKTHEKNHEIGLHAWDHHYWQAHIDKMTSDKIYMQINKGISAFKKSFDFSPICSATPAWKCNDSVLQEKSKFSFKYNSDCRGNSIFYPVSAEKKVNQLQIPVTLPTYDEVIGKNNITDSNYNDYIISLIKPDKLNVLTIHAEVEGIVCSKMFDSFLKLCQSKNISVMPLGKLVDDNCEYKQYEIIKKTISGRDGWLAVQKEMDKKKPKN